MLHFHDLRHTHKTWLIEDEVPEVLQCQRMGGVRGVYSHVSQPMIDRMLAGLQRRWELTTTASAVTTYAGGEPAMISCSQFAPTDTQKPVDEDHRQAVSPANITGGRYWD
jgi:hypothetical protein